MRASIVIILACIAFLVIDLSADLTTSKFISINTGNVYIGNTNVYSITNSGSFLDIYDLQSGGGRIARYSHTDLAWTFSGDTFVDYLNSAGEINGNFLTIQALTNQISFGSTNLAPVTTATPAAWISVQVNGNTNIYRLPIYK